MGDSTCLTIRGVDQISHIVKQYQYAAKKSGASEVEPPEMRGNLLKLGRRAARYFETIEGTPLLVYYRSRTVAKAGLQPKAAIDLSKASKIAILQVNGLPTASFVIQSGFEKSNLDGVEKVEHIQLQAATPDDSRLWVEALQARKQYYAQARFASSAFATGNGSASREKSLANSERSSNLSREELVRNGRMLLKQAGMNQADANAPAPQALPERKGLQRLNSTEFYSAESSDEEEVKLVRQLSLGRSNGSAPSSRRGSTLNNFMSDAEYERRIEFLASFPSEYPRDGWADGPIDGLQFRGYNYINDNVKVAAKDKIMKVVAVDCFSHPSKRVDHWASVPKLRFSEAKRQNSAPPFTWMIAYQVPGHGSGLTMIMYICPKDARHAKLFVGTQLEAETIAAAEGLSPGYVGLVRNFFMGNDDEFRNERFKMVPLIKEGPWIVRHAVPNKPALIGTKLKTRYFKGADYLEQDLDIASTTFIEKVTRMSVGFAKVLVCDMAYTLEGRSEKELPEQLLTVARVW